MSNPIEKLDALEQSSAGTAERLEAIRLQLGDVPQRLLAALTGYNPTRHGAQGQGQTGDPAVPAGKPPSAPPTLSSMAPLPPLGNVFPGKLRVSDPLQGTIGQLNKFPGQRPPLPPSLPTPERRRPIEFPTSPRPTAPAFRTQAAFVPTMNRPPALETLPTPERPVGPPPRLELPGRPTAPAFVPTMNRPPALPSLPSLSGAPAFPRLAPQLAPPAPARAPALPVPPPVGPPPRLEIPTAAGRGKPAPLPAPERPAMPQGMATVFSSNPMQSGRVAPALFGFPKFSSLIASVGGGEDGEDQEGGGGHLGEVVSLLRQLVSAAGKGGDAGEKARERGPLPDPEQMDWSASFSAGGSGREYFPASSPSLNLSNRAGSRGAGGYGYGSNRSDMANFNEPGRRVPKRE